MSYPGPAFPHLNIPGEVILFSLFWGLDERQAEKNLEEYISKELWSSVMFDRA
jgi:hypothetical protein